MCLINLLPSYHCIPLYAIQTTVRLFNGWKSNFTIYLNNKIYDISHIHIEREREESRLSMHLLLLFKLLHNYIHNVYYTYHRWENSLSLFYLLCIYDYFLKIKDTIRIYSVYYTHYRIIIWLYLLFILSLNTMCVF